jgi:hypothetical protein
VVTTVFRTFPVRKTVVIIAVEGVVFDPVAGHGTQMGPSAAPGG